MQTGVNENYVRLSVGIENVERALNRASLSQITELESHVSFLGTVHHRLRNYGESRGRLQPYSCSVAC